MLDFVSDDCHITCSLTPGPSGGNSDGEEPMGEQIDQPAADNEEGEKAPKAPRPRRDNKRKRKDKRTREMEKVSFMGVHGAFCVGALAPLHFLWV